HSALLSVRRTLPGPVGDLGPRQAADEPVRALEPVGTLGLEPHDDLLPDRVRTPFGDDRVAGGGAVAEQPAAAGRGRNPAREVVEASRTRVAVVDVLVEAEGAFPHELAAGVEVDEVGHEAPGRIRLDPE